MSEQVTELQVLMAEVESLPPVVERERVLSLLQSFVGQRIYFSRHRLVYRQERAQRIRVAASLLASNMTRAESVKVMMERFGLRETAARTIVNEALAPGLREASGADHAA